MEKLNLKLEGTEDFFTQEAYKTLRTNLQFCGQDVQVVAITSCHENEGKTTVTLNLARSLAELGKKVLVIDADMRKSVIAGRHTNVKNPPGLSEVLTGMVKLADSVYGTQQAQMHLIFSGKYPPNPVELLSGKYFRALIAETRKVYDYVLIDTPPLGRVIDAAVVAPNCDGVILVMADNAVRSKQAQEVVEQLRKSDSKILGVVRNNVNNKRKGYYGKYSKYYAAYRKK
ncbi:MAG: CpsD/CapB family tyrosine-protein kinase [Oscillospiraceae bacterium]|nr:CpsD/CapB family tyrosine-protein kinase [Oscillospiraceae bacterium]